MVVALPALRWTQDLRNSIRSESMLLSASILAAAPALLAPQDTPRTRPHRRRPERGGERPQGDRGHARVEPARRGFIRALDAETPGHTVSVEDYFIGATEVTEQYAEFIKATWEAPTTGAPRPPRRRVAFFQDRSNKGKTFDPAKWWEDNWQEHAWEIDPDDLLRPVIFINYQEAVNYCVWAGLRLPSEAEFQRAVRGKGKDFYPWGMEWKDNACSTAEFKADNAVLLAGMFPDGATKDGIHDLAGNVWEWTSNPYSPYPGFKPGKYKIGRSVSSPSPPGTPTGAWPWAAPTRTTASRRAAPPAAAPTGTSGPPASGSALPPLVPGKDLCERLYEREVRNSRARSIGTEFNTSTVFAMDRWQAKPTAFTGIQSAKLKRRGHYSKYAVPSTYGVIERYEYLVFSPVAQIEEANVGTWKKGTVKNGPATLGFLATSEPINPPGGDYLVAFRAAGKPEAPKDDAEAEGESAADKLVVRQDDDEGLPSGWPRSTRWRTTSSSSRPRAVVTASLPVRKAPEIVKSQGAGWRKDSEKVEIKDADGKRAFEQQPRLTLRAEVPHRLRGKVLAFELMTTVEPGLMDRAGWRG